MLAVAPFSRIYAKAATQKVARSAARKLWQLVGNCRYGVLVSRFARPVANKRARANRGSRCRCCAKKSCSKQAGTGKSQADEHEAEGHCRCRRRSRSRRCCRRAPPKTHCQNLRTRSRCAVVHRIGSVRGVGVGVLSSRPTPPRAGRIKLGRSCRRDAGRHDRQGGGNRGLAASLRAHAAVEAPAQRPQAEVEHRSTRWRCAHRCDPRFLGSHCAADSGRLRQHALGRSSW